MLYEALKPVATTALSWYYRSVAVAGRSRIPATGPVILAVNHPNALVDALVVACVVPRRVHFTAKATIFANPLVAAFLRTVGVIPLKRVSDEMRHAAAAAPPPVATDTAPGASATLDPARNADAFRAVGEALGEGRVIVIFPEGKSHDEPALAPLRTGLARMALMARDTAHVAGIHIVPLGLLFERKEEPRSRVLVQTGEAIAVDALPRGEHAVELLTALVAERLAAVTLNFETTDDARRLTAVSETLAALLEPESTVGHDGPSLATVLAILRRTERVRRAIEATSTEGLDERAQQFEQRVAAYRRRLDTEHLALRDVGIDRGVTPGIRFALREGLLAALLLPVSWWGRITHFLPIRLARWLALRGARNRDEPAMNTLLFGLALVLASYLVETAVVWRLFGGWWAVAFALTLVPSATSDLRYGDRTRRRTERMRAYFTFRRHPRLQQELLVEAEWLRREAGTLETMV